jgi:hypothetical protein
MPKQLIAQALDYIRLISREPLNKSMATLRESGAR